MTTLEIITCSDLTELQEIVNEFFDSMPKIKIIKIHQTEKNDLHTIFIYYKPS